MDTAHTAKSILERVRAQTDAEITHGARYGRLTVLAAAEPAWLVGIGGGVQPRVRVRCDCGRESDVFWNGLRNGVIADCGQNGCGDSR